MPRLGAKRSGSAMEWEVPLTEGSAIDKCWAQPMGQSLVRAALNEYYNWSASYV